MKKNDVYFIYLAIKMKVYIYHATYAYKLWKFVLLSKKCTVINENKSGENPLCFC